MAILDMSGSLEDISNTRLRNLKERTLRYRFRMVHIPGVRNKTSDALSRHPSGCPAPQKMPLQDDHQGEDADCRQKSPRIPSTLLAGISIVPQTEDEDDTGLKMALCEALDSTPISWEDIQASTISDPCLQSLSDLIEDGIPERRHEMPADTHLIPVSCQQHLLGSFTSSSYLRF